MKSPALNRVLEKSTAKTLTALSVGAFLRADHAELNRIYGALPSHDQQSRHDFFIRHHATTESILLWAVEYWKTFATVRTYMAVSLAPGIDDKELSITTFMLNANKAKLATLIEAMQQICTEAGIDFVDVAAFAEVDTEIDAKPIPQLVAEYVEMFGITG